MVLFMRLEAKEYFSSISDKLAIYSSDPEDNNKEHSHEFHELVIVKSGHGLHVIHNQPLFIKKGDVFFVKKMNTISMMSWEHSNLSIY